MTKRLNQYDAAYVPMREPDFRTWQFDDHVYRCLQLAWKLQRAGVVRHIVVSGGRARWYKGQIEPPFFAESEEGKKYLVNKLGCPSDRVLTEWLSETSIENHMRTARKVFIPHDIRRVLLITARERALRLHYLGERVFPQEKVTKFHFTIAGVAPDLEKNEAFALAMQKEYLQGVPQGKEGWGLLMRSEFEGPDLLPFWRKYDAAKAALRAAMPPGSTPAKPDVIAHMGEGGLSPGMRDFACAAGNLVLPNAMGHPAFRSIQDLLPDAQLMPSVTPLVYALEAQHSHHGASKSLQLAIP